MTIRLLFISNVKVSFEISVLLGNTFTGVYCTCFVGLDVRNMKSNLEMSQEIDGA